ncbi:MAG TPA: LysR substrate-binding domain-containing protein [Sphingomicrobium sp.]|nr:LysR substrate-binding domain-containing protein [Sphingomicrobium sp.]
MPSLVSIGAFEAAARHGSFAKAAAELGTSAASVSYHIRQLEHQIGARLFRRMAQRVELTEAGAAAAGSTIEAFGLLRSSFQRAADVDRTSLRITALPTFGTSWLVPRLGQVKRTLPGVSVDVDLSAEARDLISGGFDVAIRNGHGQWRGLQSTFLFPSIFMPLCAPAVLIEVKDSAWPRPQSQIPLLGRQDWWEIWFKTLGVDHACASQFRFADEYLDAEAAIAGNGITLASPLLCRRDLEAGRLVPAHSLVVATGRSFWLIYPPSRRGVEKVARFADWISSEAETERRASKDWIEAAVAPA